MIVRNLLLLGGVAVLASACATTTPVDGQQGADVVDNSVGTSQQSNQAQDNSESFGLDPQDQFQGSPLEDPNSLLSQTTILFDFDSAEIQADFLPVIEAHAQFMLQNTEYQLTIEGHTDERGSREYNIGLGENRAGAVQRAFQLHGVSPERITVISFGEEKPVALGQGEEFWSKNRRAELMY